MKRKSSWRLVGIIVGAPLVAMIGDELLGNVGYAIALLSAFLAAVVLS